MTFETIGNCKLYNEDLFDVLPALPQGQIDAIITDPPYGCTNAAWDKPIDLAAYWREAHRVTKINAIHAVFCMMPFAGTLWASNKKNFRYDLIYTKAHVANFLNANNRPLRKHELIYIFFRKKGTYNPQKTPGEPYIRTNCSAGECYNNYNKFTSVNKSGLRHPHTILTFPRDKNLHNILYPRGSVHSTQKNIHALRWLVRTYSNPGESVLDPMMGAATTGAACLMEGRSFIGIEKEARWFDLACERLAKLRDELAQKRDLLDLKGGQYANKQPDASLIK